MITRTISAAIQGVDVSTVEVEIIASGGQSNSEEPKLSIIGLPDASIRESKDRVRSALIFNKFYLPDGFITINLAPAAIKKSGALYDLPIALCLTAAAGLFPPEELDQSMIVGELGLNGDVRACAGVLPMALHAKALGLKRIFVPVENAREAATVQGLTVYGVSTLKEVVLFFRERRGLLPVTVDVARLFSERTAGDADYSDVKGQESAKRAMMIAAAGRHNVLLVGSPGVGKSLIASRLPSILPLLSFEEALEVSKIYSIAGEMPPHEGLITKRPFRAPHHTVSDAGLMGGGTGMPRPGEITLAHRGVLFLDELPEFRRNVLEALRQPMENGKVTIARASGSYDFPADFMLVAAMNPCPCGYLGSQQRRCTCPPAKVIAYRSKISGPLLDRLDILIEVPPISEQQMTAKRNGEPSASMLKKVLAARAMQKQRFQGTQFLYNSQISGKYLDELCPLAAPCLELLKSSIRELNMSPRSYDRIIRVSRTIADLEQSPDIRPEHICEALAYRSFDQH